MGRAGSGAADGRRCGARPGQGGRVADLRHRTPHPPRRAGVHRVDRRAGGRARALVSLRRSPPRTWSTPGWRCSCATPGSSVPPGWTSWSRPCWSGPRSTGTRRSSAARTACTPSRPPSALKLLGLGDSSCAATRDAAGEPPSKACAVGKLSGAVGSYANPIRGSRRWRLSALGLECEPVATQVVPATGTRSCSRRSPAPAPAWSGSPWRSGTCSGPRCARRSSRSRRARRARRPCRTSETRSCASGSAAWPGCCGQRRRRPREHRAVARARHLALLGRAGDAARLARSRLDYMLDRMRWLVEGLEVDPEPHAARTWRTATGWSSPAACCCALVEAGLPREAAYEMVQRNAMRGLGRGHRRCAGCWRPTRRPRCSP